MLKMSKFGDWTKAGAVLQALGKNLKTRFSVQLQEDGEFILSTLKGHIENQDLNWRPLEPETVIRKGNDLIYIETGFLFDNLEVRKVRAPKDGITFFVGASAWKRTPDGVKLSDLMIWLEYGTHVIPPRPLIRPTLEEVTPIITKNWGEILKKIIKEG
jgi:hypothetical protein